MVVALWIPVSLLEWKGEALLFHLLRKHDWALQTKCNGRYYTDVIPTLMEFITDLNIFFISHTPNFVVMGFWAFLLYIIIININYYSLSNILVLPTHWNFGLSIFVTKWSFNFPLYWLRLFHFYYYIVYSFWFTAWLCVSFSLLLQFSEFQNEPFSDLFMESREIDLITGFF